MFGPHNSGKTYMLKGLTITGKDRGMLSRTVEEMLKLMALYSVMNEEQSHKMSFRMTFAAGLSFKGEMTDLIGEGKDLMEKQVSSIDQFNSIYNEAMNQRKTQQIAKQCQSYRKASHTVFKLTIEKKVAGLPNQYIKLGTLSFLELASCESHSDEEIQQSISRTYNTISACLLNIA